MPPHGLTLFLSATFSLFLAAADPEASERAGRYVHFYALIYAHAYTKNNPVSKLKDNKRSAGDVADTLPPRLISFHILIHFARVSFFLPADLIIYYRVGKLGYFSRGLIPLHVLQPRE